MSTYTPFPILATGTAMIAPFFADVWTYGTGTVHYGADTVGGNAAFGVDWFSSSGTNLTGVGYYANSGPPENIFQMILVDRADTGAGNFDIEFNYNQILWETGNYSGGSGGLGGIPARIGYSNGAGASYELPGSGIAGSFLDSGAPATSLIDNSNVGVSGRYEFSARNGVIGPSEAPEPGSLALVVGAGVLMVFGARRRSRHSRVQAWSPAPAPTTPGPGKTLTW